MVQGIGARTFRPREIDNVDLGCIYRLGLCEKGAEFNGEYGVRAGGTGIHGRFVGLTRRDPTTQNPECFLQSQSMQAPPCEGIDLGGVGVDFTESRDEATTRGNVPFEG